jgi:hypothetical protein
VSLKGFHGEDFNAYVNLVADIKCKMLYKKVIGNKRVFTKLNFYCYSVFDEIGLIVTKNWLLSRRLDFLFCSSGDMEKFSELASQFS